MTTTSYINGLPRYICSVQKVMVRFLSEQPDRFRRHCISHGIQHDYIWSYVAVWLDRVNHQQLALVPDEDVSHHHLLVTITIVNQEIKYARSCLCRLPTNYGMVSSVKALVVLALTLRGYDK